MGGHTQSGEFKTLDEAVINWKGTIVKCVDEWELFLAYGQIKYEDNKYKLAMRFTK